MLILTTAVIIVGALCVADLLLTFGVIRRLRSHTEMLTGIGTADMSAIGLDTGQSPDAFNAVSTDGEQLSGSVGLLMAGFFSSSCSICPERVPTFVDYVKENHLGRDSVLAVIVGSDSQPPSYLDRLSEVARICLAPVDGELTAAFKVTGYPAFVLLDADGAVRATAFDPAMLPVPVPG